MSERATIFLQGGPDGPLSVQHFIGDSEDVGFDLRAAGFRVDRASKNTITLDVGAEEMAAAIALLRSWGYVVVLVDGV